jgi:MFS family permease
LTPSLYDRYYRWLVLLSMCVTIGAQSGIRLSFSVFYVTLREDFGWSAASTASVFSVYMLVQATCSPLIGWCLDRYGVRRLFPLAAMWVGGSLLLCSGMQNLAQFMLAYGVLLPIGQTGLAAGPVSVVLARWFPEMRSRAIALADVGAALGLGLYPLLSRWLIVSYGWRWAFVWLGVSMVLLVVPLTFWQRPAPSHRADARHAEPPQPCEHHTSHTAARPSWTLRRAMRTLPFWMLFGTLLCMNLSSQVLNVHLMALLISMGVVANAAAGMVGLVNLVSLAGRLGLGWMADSIGRSLAFTVALVCSMIGIGFLLHMTPANASWVIIAFVASFGLTKGSGGIMIASKAADVFYGDGLGRIYGVITMASGLAGALGPLWAGWLVDRTGQYTLAMWTSLIMAAGAIVCMWMVDAGMRGPRQNRFKRTA